MNQFYLNNAVGAPASIAEGSKALKGAVMAFSQLASCQDLNISPRIVLDKDPELIKFGDYYLRQLLEGVEDREEKRQAYAIMRAAYPMEELFGMDEGDMPLMDAAYQFEGRDATNIAIACRHDGLLLSLAFSESLKHDRLTFTSTAVPSDAYPSAFEMDNLYGEDSNTSYMQSVIEKREGVAVDLYERITMLENTMIEPTFERSFNKLTTQMQKSIVDGFEEAVRQQLLNLSGDEGTSPINPNDELVRFEPYSDKEKIFALAIYQPLAIRVFLAQYAHKLYILSIASKKELQDGKKQNAAIRAAEERFKKMKKAL